MVSERIILPDFYMPYPPEGTNPRARAAESTMWEWLVNLDLVPEELSRRRVAGSRPVEMYSMWCPDADVESLALLAEFTAWAFIVDDQFDIEMPDPRRCLATIQRLETGFDLDGTPSGVLATGFQDLWRRLCRGRSPQWRRAVRAEIVEWWWSYYTESVRTITRDLPQLDEYRTHRQISVAIYMLLDLSEITYGIDLPDTVRQLPAMKTLRAAVTEHMGLINDVHSLPADEAVGYAYNAVLLAEYHLGCTRTHALRVVNEMLTDCILRIGRMEEALAEELDVLGVTGQARDDTLHTLEDYRRYVRANFDFHYRAPRYTSPPIEALAHGQLLS
ncbi:hypothetical protein ACFV4K_32865 [Nocardia sp. NPDC059764]|uniref:terpene synthase family protein n=1 Tax=Nocardia sp. NPDC059764 TaxID=3346939 RepID=UPI00364A9413